MIVVATQNAAASISKIDSHFDPVEKENQWFIDMYSSESLKK